MQIQMNTSPDTFMQAYKWQCSDIDMGTLSVKVVLYEFQSFFHENCFIQAGKLTATGDTANLCMKPPHERVSDLKFVELIFIFHFHFHKH